MHFFFALKSILIEIWLIIGGKTTQNRFWYISKTNCLWYFPGILFSILLCSIFLYLHVSGTSYKLLKGVLFFKYYKASGFLTSPITHIYCDCIWPSFYSRYAMLSMCYGFHSCFFESLLVWYCCWSPCCSPCLPSSEVV